MVLHQEQINEILELYRYGWLQKEIAEKFQIGNRTVGRLHKSAEKAHGFSRGMRGGSLEFAQAIEEGRFATAGNSFW